MPDYDLTVRFTAPDEEAARKRADDIADLCAVEHGTRDPIVTPADGELANLVRDAVTGWASNYTSEITNAVMAVVTPALERLRGDLGNVMRIVNRWCVEYNDVGGVDAGDLAWRLEEAGYPLPDPEESTDAC